MARKKRRPKVFYNGAVDTWSNDSMNEPYLMPGTEAYAAYQESLKKQVGEDVDDELGKTPDEDISPDNKQEEEQYDATDVGLDVAKRKFRRQQSKASQDKEIQHIVSEGLGKSVDISGGVAGEYGLPGISNSDELYDDGIDADSYKHEVIKDYRKQLDSVERETPTIDTDGDGKSDEQEMTPGAKAMRKYM